MSLSGTHMFLLFRPSLSANLLNFRVFFYFLEQVKILLCALPLNNSVPSPNYSLRDMLKVAFDLTKQLLEL